MQYFLVMLSIYRHKDFMILCYLVWFVQRDFHRFLVSPFVLNSLFFIFLYSLMFMLAKNLTFLSKFSCGLTNFLCLANFNYFNRSYFIVFGIWDKSQSFITLIFYKSPSILASLGQFYLLFLSCFFTDLKKSFTFLYSASF